MYTIGIDVGGTKTQGGVVDARGRVVRRFRTDTNARAGRAAILRAIETTVGALRGPRVAGIGVGLAGFVDPKRGIFRRGPHLHSFENIPLAKILRAKFHKKVFLDNDANCFALAEASVGAGRGKRFVVGLTLGTGIGGGIVMDGDIYHGAHNKAGELGHMMQLLRWNVPCACGGYNHIEALAGGKGMTAAYFRATGRRVDAREIEALYKRRNRAAIQVVHRASEALGAGMAATLTAFDPDILVLGGGLIRFKDYVACGQKALRKAFYKEPGRYSELAKTPVVLSKLGDDAQVIGASLLVQ